jgi:hypothetical protein
MTDLKVHREFAEAAIARSAMGLSAGTLQPLVRADVPADPERDKTGFFFNEMRGDQRYFIVVSSTRFPDFLAVVAQRTVAALDAVGPRLGRRICAPLHWGSIDGRSYIIYNDLALLSSNRIGVRVQKYWTAPSILGWLVRVQSMTARDVAGAADLERRFLGPLRKLEGDTDMSGVSQGRRGPAGAFLPKAGPARSFASSMAISGSATSCSIPRVARWARRSRPISGSSTGADRNSKDMPASTPCGSFYRPSGPDAGRPLSCGPTGARWACHARNWSCTSTAALGYPIGAATEFPKERMNALTERVHRFLDDNGFLEGLPRARATQSQRLPMREGLRSHT